MNPPRQRRKRADADPHSASEFITTSVVREILGGESRYKVLEKDPRFPRAFHLPGLEPSSITHRLRSEVIAFAALIAKEAVDAVPDLRRWPFDPRTRQKREEAQAPAHK